MSRPLTPLQEEGFRIFAEEHPQGVPYSDLGKYKQTTIGSMWGHGWIHYLPGKNKVSLSLEGRQAWIEWKDYLQALTLVRRHESDHLSIRIDVTAPRKGKNGRKRSSTKALAHRAA